MMPFLPGATDHHFVNALRFWPRTSSTSGMSASGHGPVAPSGPEAMVTLCIASANPRTFAAGIVAPFGPVTGRDHEYAESFSEAVAALPWRTTTWKPSYSLRAAEMAAEAPGGSGSDGRILVVPSATRTVAARAVAAIKERTATSEMRVEFAMGSPDGSARQRTAGPPVSGVSGRLCPSPLALVNTEREQ